MSALANSRANTNNNVVHNIAQTSDARKPTAVISVTARIDYIQRFSKQMSVVIDNNPATYSQLARQYLTNISEESNKQDVNVAFVAASSKLNDIQMRCRLIEQLFGNTLFDPEQSLAVSLLRLAKKNNDEILVLVEHAQSLSLQIKYELCQLVDIAKKTQNNVNVVLFGLEQTAKEISLHKSIFENKTSIVDANDGQILALDHPRFKSKTKIFNKKSILKISLITLVCVFLSTLAAYFLANYENFSLTKLPVTPVIEEVKETPLLVQMEKETAVIKQANLASSQDVYLALLGQEDITEQAQMNDILLALSLTESTSENGIVTKPETASNTSIISTKEQAIDFSFDEQLFLNSEQGFVVQITGFSNISRLSSFKAEHSSVEILSYQKSLNNQRFIVLTTQIFDDKLKAKAALASLPQSLKDLGAFLKSVSTIKDEINTVNR